MKKKALSLALALALCLGLSVPAFAAEAKAGDTSVSITDDAGFTHTLELSNPIIKVKAMASGSNVTVYQLPKGTAIVPVIPANAKNTSETFVKYNLTDDHFVSYLDNLNGFPHQGEEGQIFTEGKPLGVGTHEIECRNTWSDGAGYSGSTVMVYFEIVESDEQPTDPKPTTPAVEVEDIPASGTAIASTQTVTVDGKAVEFQMYALKDANGNLTNYIKLRDMAYVLNGTKAQFAVGYDGAISLTTGEAYEAGGTEMTTPYSGDRAYTGGSQTIKINGEDVAMTAITLTDDNGGGYNYFKLRDLGKALGFNVGYSNENGVFIESDKPYAG